MTTREEALSAMLLMNQGAEMVADGIPAHIAEHPELDPETKVILEMSARAIIALTGIAQSSFEQALAMEDLNDEIIADIRRLLVP